MIILLRAFSLALQYKTIRERHRHCGGRINNIKGRMAAVLAGRIARRIFKAELHLIIVKLISTTQIGFLFLTY